MALAALLAAAFSGVGYRLELLSLPAAFNLLRVAAYTAIPAVFISLIGMVFTRPGGRYSGLTMAVMGGVVGFLVFWHPYDLLRTARSVPPIHDITTDTGNPPQFKTLVPTRADAPNGYEYGGPDIARQQKTAYSDIRSARLTAPPEDVFTAVLDIARDSGWDIVDSTSDEGRIEATATTLWFGFKDDVVIRITTFDTITIVDVRSASRVGQSDLGLNAERIRKFLRTLKSRFDALDG